MKFSRLKNLTQSEMKMSLVFVLGYKPVLLVLGSCVQTPLERR